MTNSQAATHESWLVRCSSRAPEFNEAISITRSKISYSFIDSQPLCTPACGCEFHSFAAHPHPTFTAPPVRSAFGIWSESVVELFCGNSLRVKAIGYFRREAPSLMFGGELNVTLSEEKGSTTGVTQGNLELLLRLILLIYTKHK